MEGRQIQAAFVYTDLDSFTKIVATQPGSSSFVLLQAVVKLVTLVTSHYSGSVVDCAGDRLLSVFHRPAKDCSWEPVQQAVTAAFWIHTVLHSTAPVFAGHGIVNPTVGIGIDYGPAVVGCVGIRNNKRLIFLGDAANNAARLQDLASAGQTVLSFEAYLRKPPYMNSWQMIQEADERVVYRYRTDWRFADDTRPPRST
jgi:class 3 adenylate cyclase